MGTIRQRGNAICARVPALTRLDAFIRALPYIAIGGVNCEAHSGTARKRSLTQHYT